MNGDTERSDVKVDTPKSDVKVDTPYLEVKLDNLTSDFIADKSDVKVYTPQTGVNISQNATPATKLESQSDERISKQRLLQYTTPQQSGVNISGAMFPENNTRLLRIPQRFIDLQDYDVMNFTFVTCADWHHYKESRDAIGGFQKVFPNHSFIYYDIGLRPTEAEEV